MPTGIVDGLPVGVQLIGQRREDTTFDAAEVIALGGPDVVPLAQAARGYLAAVHRRRPVVEVPVPGAFSRSFRAGANLVPGNRAGGRTWQEFLAGQPESDLLPG